MTAALAGCWRRRRRRGAGRARARAATRRRCPSRSAWPAGRRSATGRRPTPRSRCARWRSSRRRGRSASWPSRRPPPAAGAAAAAAEAAARSAARCLPPVSIFSAPRGASGTAVRGWRTTAPARSPEAERSARERAVELFDRGARAARGGGRYGEALDAWEKALALAPDNRIYQANVQRLRGELGRLRARDARDRRRQRAARRAPDAGRRGGRRSLPPVAAGGVRRDGRRRRRSRPRAPRAKRSGARWAWARSTSFVALVPRRSSSGVVEVGGRRRVERARRGARMRRLRGRSRRGRGDVPLRGRAGGGRDRGDLQAARSASARRRVTAAAATTPAASRSPSSRSRYLDRARLARFA